MTGHRLTVALVSELFFDDPDGSRLAGRLRDVARLGAELAVLPELPLDRWFPASSEARDENAEGAGGVRHARMAEAAREARIWLLGGAIVRSLRSGRRYSTALLFDGDGELRGTHRKIHLPDEEGFWEARHYEPGTAAPSVTQVGGVPVGIQICSDIQRLQGAHLLAASGAELILVPRATPAASYERWLLVLRAAALTAASYVVSVNRLGPDPGSPAADASVEIGGPSVAIDPEGEILLETEDPEAIVEVDRRVVRRARQGYPGYLSARADVYAMGWSRLVAELGAASG